MSAVAQSFEPYEVERFLQWVHCLSLLGPLAPIPPPDAPDARRIDQAHYLANYIGRDLKAKTLLVERPYIDRHYIEEYTGYYARTLRPPPPHAARIHLFSEDLDQTGFRRCLMKIASGTSLRSAIEEELAKIYLGYVVIRPLRDVPIGRTILRTIGSAGQPRNYRAAESRNDVHLAGLTLPVVGLPFQQQDQGVGACATTAVWSTLSGALRQIGRRAPTPLEVTYAAHRVRGQNRRIPAIEGLEPQQMSAAIAAFGLIPTYFSTTQEPKLFAAALKCYLVSGIPVVLHVSGGTDVGGHAMAAVGFSDKPDDLDTITSLGLRVRALRRIYVHDDRLGPYARFQPHSSADDFKIKMIPSAQGDEWAMDFADDMTVYHGIAPHYPKLRMTAMGLLGVAAGWLKIVQRAVKDEARAGLHVNTRFELGGDVLAQLLESDFPQQRAVDFAQTAFLSRYVGVVEILLGEDLLFMALCDATDVNRDRQPTLSTIAVVPYDNDLRDMLEELGIKYPEMQPARVV
ncbi:MAG: hypothetical protein ACNA8W_00885 [Bradymonadaceae bacterium]